MNSLICQCHLHLGRFPVSFTSHAQKSYNRCAITEAPICCVREQAYTAILGNRLELSGKIEHIHLWCEPMIQPPAHTLKKCIYKNICSIISYNTKDNGLNQDIHKQYDKDTTLDFYSGLLRSKIKILILYIKTLLLCSMCVYLYLLLLYIELSI